MASGLLYTGPELWLRAATGERDLLLSSVDMAFIYHRGNLARDRRHRREVEFISVAVFYLSTTRVSMLTGKPGSGLLELSQRRLPLREGYEYRARVLCSPHLHTEAIAHAFSRRHPSRI